MTECMFVCCRPSSIASCVGQMHHCLCQGLLSTPNGFKSADIAGSSEAALGCPFQQFVCIVQLRAASWFLGAALTPAAALTRSLFCMSMVLLFLAASLFLRDIVSVWVHGGGWMHPCATLACCAEVQQTGR